MSVNFTIHLSRRQKVGVFGGFGRSGSKCLVILNITLEFFGCPGISKW
jgi:hypothetical protein